VAADRKGNVYVVESNGHSLVRRIGAGGVVSTVAGTRGVTGITMTSLAPPGRMAVAPNGDVYVISGQALLRLVMQ
jgi:hypothetical protein